MHSHIHRQASKYWLFFLCFVCLAGVFVRGLFGRTLHFDHLKLKDQRSSCINMLSLVTVAIGQGIGDVELPGVSLFHQLHGFSPALDDLVGGEGRGLSSFVRGIELGGLVRVLHLFFDCPPFVMAFGGGALTGGLA